MAKKRRKCKFCKQSFSPRDEFVDARITATYNSYHYDAGSDDNEEKFRICHECLTELYAWIEARGKKKPKAKKMRLG
jgi:hypothetical protein